MSRIAVVLFLLVPFFLLAQPQKKDWMVGGAGNANYRNDKLYIDLSPNAAYLVANKLAIGLGFNYSSYFYKDYITKKIFTDNVNYEIAPFIRYYAGKNRWRFPFTVKIGAGRSLINYDEYYGYTKVMQANTFSQEAGCGVSYFVNKNVAIELTGAIRHVSTEYDSSPFFITKVWTSDCVPVFHFGFQIFLRKKNELTVDETK